MAAPMEVTRSLAKIAVCVCRQRCLPALSQVHIRSMASDSAASSTVGNASAAKVEKISQAMKSYLERAQAHDKFMSDEVTEYEIGKRHLANIMGADPDTFSQDDINVAIEYLLPSGLYDKKARPMMKHPTDVIPTRKAAQFGMDGRPFDSFFYTSLPGYYRLMHDAAVKFEKLKDAHATLIAKGDVEIPDNKLMLAGSQWVTKHVVEQRLNDRMSDLLFDRLIKLLARLAEHPCSHMEKEFIMSFRKRLQGQSQNLDPELLRYDENGRGYMDAEGSRKLTTARVRIWDRGSGKMQINNRDLIDFFPRLIDREQLMFPLHFTNKLGEVDVVASVDERGDSSAAGAIRFAMSKALQSFTTRENVEKMRLAGLLTKDPRRRERKKPGQEGARRKFTWKKR